MPRAAANSVRDTVVPLALLAGDATVTFAALSLGWWLRYASPINRSRFAINVPGATFGAYLPLLLVGVALLLTAFAQLGLYDTRLILRRFQSLSIILKSAAFWFATYLGVSLVLKLDPPISLLFVGLAFICVVVLLHAWRTAAYTLIVRSPLLATLRRRTVLLGWNDAARDLAADIARDPHHPYLLIGLVTLDGDTAPFTSATPADLPPRLGGSGELDAILQRENADLLIATRLDLPREDLRRIVETCEHSYVEWKAVPGSFDVFLSGLRLQTIGRVPVLGVEELAITRLFNRGLKRTFDLVGGLVGLILSSPLLLLLTFLIRRESPGAPALFRQRRIGAGHRAFTLLKLRSMAPGAEAADHERQSTARGDARLLQIGAWMRRWNLDELPQFWNVLRGDMSLVGPRPERPLHVDRLAAEIPHYLPRHLVKPGMTGWAQVNGLRGEGDLAARVRHDIYYIENWSIWLDVQIVLLTFVRWRNPGE